MRKGPAIALEALLVAALGVAFALAANALSPRGLRLSRDYFPEQSSAAKTSPATKSTAGTTGLPAVAIHPPGASPTDAIAQKLQQRGLQIVSSNEVVELYRDPRREQGLIVFIDARDDSHYTSGHIPGAWQLDRFRPENYLPSVLPACLAALKVVIYCSGGECEDSAFAAILLREAGVPADALFVYIGGITEWKAGGSPMETGPRGSGTVTP
jgi:rhodanese-related sulfurtransferase